MREPNTMVMGTIKYYAERFLKDNNDGINILYSKKSLIEHNKGTLMNSTEIEGILSNKKTFDWYWNITDEKYYTNYLSEDGYECYELIEDINGWDATLIILPPSPTEKQKEEWNKVVEFLKNNINKRYAMW